MAEENTFRSKIAQRDIHQEIERFNANANIALCECRRESNRNA